MRIEVELPVVPGIAVGRPDVCVESGADKADVARVGSESHVDEDERRSSPLVGVLAGEAARLNS